MDIEWLTVGFEIRFVGSFVKVQGYVQKINDLFVGINCYFQTIVLEHFIANLFLDSFEALRRIFKCSQAVISIQANLISNGLRKLL